eukprot:UN11633
MLSTLANKYTVAEVLDTRKQYSRMCWYLQHPRTYLMWIRTSPNQFYF